MNFGELLGICFTIGGAIYGIGYLVDEKYPFAGGLISVIFMFSGLLLYYFSLKAHEHALEMLSQLLSIFIV